jgi:type VII secretion-associated protein (TIGR03931 family)
VTVLVVHLGYAEVAAAFEGCAYRGPAAARLDGQELRFGERALESAEPEMCEPAVLRYIDDEHLVLGRTPVRMAAVLGGLIAHAARQVGAPEHVGLLVLTHPSAWGQVRRQALYAAVHPAAPQVALVPFAEALAQGLVERGEVRNACVVAEFEDAGATASLVRLIEHRCQRGAAARVPDAQAGLDAALDVAAQVRGDITWPSLDLVVLGSGESAGFEDTVDVLAPEPGLAVVAISIGRRRHQLATAGAKVLVGVHGSEIAAVEPAPIEPAAVDPTADDPPVLLRAAPGPAGATRPLRRGWAAAATVVAAAASVVAVWWLAPGSPAPDGPAAQPHPQPTAQSSSQPEPESARVVAAGIEVLLPRGWSESSAPDEAQPGQRQRAILTDGDGGRIHLQRNELAQGVAFDSVSAELERLLGAAEAQPKYTGFVPRSSVAGRQAATYMQCWQTAQRCGGPCSSSARCRSAWAVRHRRRARRLRPAPTRSAPRGRSERARPRTSHWVEPGGCQAPSNRMNQRREAVRRDP